MGGFLFVCCSTTLQMFNGVLVFLFVLKRCIYYWCLWGLLGGGGRGKRYQLSGVKGLLGWVIGGRGRWFAF
ncbi:hypothetical protein QBC41DRAFT_311300 [Cercophora samala]|uniref:Uncharacterized protein n=1 Tax=Cercophora samala TaxID=330535 RepID=A0AA39ZM60_9PEZI|nr:hypothetical protein QBC41DRAFT_311300 [Cercophora samala]